jgi:hypothetical protein
MANVRVAEPRLSGAGKLSSTMNCVDDDGANVGNVGAAVGCFVGDTVVVGHVPQLCGHRAGTNAEYRLQ